MAEPLKGWFSSASKAWLKWCLVLLLGAAYFLLGIGTVRLWRRLRQAADQREVVAQIRDLEGRVFFEYQHRPDESDERLVDAEARPGPDWLYRLLGHDLLHRVFYVSFAEFKRSEGGLLALDRLQVTDAQLVPLKKLPALRWLDLNGTRVTDAGLEYVEEIVGLRRLWLSHTAVTDAGLKRLEKLTDLERLDIDGTGVTDDTLERLAGLSRLERLALNDTRVTDAGMAHLTELKNLKHLLLGVTQVTDAGLAHVAQLNRLERLTLSGTRVTDAGLAHLGNLRGLNHLLLDGTQISDAGMERLGDLSNLETLSLAATEVGDAGLAQLRGMTRLHALQVDESNCTLSGVMHLFTQLQERTVEEALEAVARTKHNADGRLTSLDLSEIRVTDAGLAHLKGLTTLEWLDLSSTDVTDAGLKHLEGLTNLSLLDLTRTGVTDAGLEQLSALANLRTLHLGQTDVTDEGVEKLEEALAGRVRVYRVAFSHRKSLELTMQDVSSHVRLANILVRQGRTAEAETHFRKAIQWRAHRKGAHHGLAVLLNRQGRVEEAIRHAQEALRIDPDYFEAHMDLGLMLLEGDGVKAGEHLARAVRLKPRDAFANYWYGHVLHFRGDLAGAAAHYQTAAARDPEFVMPLLGLAAIRIMADHPDSYDPEEAVSLAERACQVTEHRDASALEILGKIYAAAGRLEEAIGATAQAVRIARAAGDEELARRIQKNLTLYQQSNTDQPDK